MSKLTRNDRTNQLASVDFLGSLFQFFGICCERLTSCRPLSPQWAPLRPQYDLQIARCRLLNQQQNHISSVLTTESNDSLATGLGLAGSLPAPGWRRRRSWARSARNLLHLTLRRQQQQQHQHQHQCVESTAPAETVVESPSVASPSSSASENETRVRHGGSSYSTV